MQFNGHSSSVTPRLATLRLKYEHRIIILNWKSFYREASHVHNIRHCMDLPLSCHYSTIERVLLVGGRLVIRGTDSCSTVVVVTSHVNGLLSWPVTDCHHVETAQHNATALYDGIVAGECCRKSIKTEEK